MRKTLRIRALSMLSLATTFLFVVLVNCTTAFAQTLTTGAISGTVTDATGAVVPSATVTVTNVGTGATRSAHTNTSGEYVVPQLNPGQYKVKVGAAGFREEEVGPVTVAVSQVATMNVRLEVGRVTQLVEVTGQAAIIQTDNPNTTTNLSATQIDVIPNPGNDLSYEANFAPGAVMNTAGGYGNVEFNGLPATSNNFTIDGLDANDAFFNVNNSGATNLQLGLGAMQEVSVNSSSYSVDQGRMPAAQINYITKSGSNTWHGNAWETYDGSFFNAADYFINSHAFESPAPRKSRSDVNIFGGSFGGPIKHDKLFFYTDLEGTRIVLPVVANTTEPTAAYENYVLNQLTVGGCDYYFDPSGCAAGSSPLTYPAHPEEASFYQTAFSLYGQKGGTPTAILGCPIDINGNILPIPSTATPTAGMPDGAGCALARTFPLVNHTGETLWTIKIDHNINSSNTVWYRFQMDNGVQAAYTDSINPVFNTYSDQPERNGNAGWTHTFSSNVVNQFNPGFAWYRAQWVMTPKAYATFPIVLASNFTGLGGENYIWPQGRDVTQWQLNDNLSWTKGRHELKFGENLRRVLVSDHDFGFFDTPYIDACDMPEFTYGVACWTEQSFPKSLDEPFGIVNLDAYAMDTLKATSKLTLTLGVRGTWNSNPLNQQKLISRLTGSYYDIGHSVTQPLNAVITPGLPNTFASTPLIIWQPRVALAFKITPNTVVRAGGGVFSDLFPASISDSMATNPPYDNTFYNGWANGGAINTAIAPTVPNSAVSYAMAEQQAFLSGFSAGAVSCMAPNAPSNCVPQVGMNAITKYTHTPYALEWSFGIQRQFANNWGLDLKYQGTGGREIPYTMGPNGYETLGGTACPGCFSPWPSTAPDQRFFGFTQYESGANSNYHALQVTGRKRMSHGVNFELNYTWSHCLDTISNGGILPLGGSNIQNAIPGELYRNYGPCDYDFRQSLNGFYTYQLPFHAANPFLNKIIGGWQVSGSIIFKTGQPFSMNSWLPSGTLNETSGPQFANLVPGQPLYNKANIGTDCVANPAGCVTNAGNIQWLNPTAFESVVDSTTGMCIPRASGLSGMGTALANEAANAATCQLGDMQRNFLRGPGLRWGDIFVSKKFKITERLNFSVDGQFFNAFNHPNFANFGTATAGVPTIQSTLTGFGNIGSMASPATGLLGSFLGGDSAVRMIAFKARLEF